MATVSIAKLASQLWSIRHRRSGLEDSLGLGDGQDRGRCCGGGERVVRFRARYRIDAAEGRPAPKRVQLSGDSHDGRVVRGNVSDASSKNMPCLSCEQPRASAGQTRCATPSPDLESPFGQRLSDNPIIYRPNPCGTSRRDSRLSCACVGKRLNRWFSTSYVGQATSSRASLMTNASIASWTFTF